MTDIANETTVAAFCRRLPVHCDSCGKDRETGYADPRPENRGNHLCASCWDWAMHQMDVRHGAFDGADDGKLTWLTLPR